MPLDLGHDVSFLLRAGVYVLLSRGEVVYVGQSRALLPRLCAHRNSAKQKNMPSWHPVKRVVFDEVRVVPCRIEEMDELERELINRYRPRLNVKLKPPSEVPMLQPIDLNFNGVKWIINATTPVVGLTRRV